MDKEPEFTNSLTVNAVTWNSLSSVEFLLQSALSLIGNDLN